MRDTSPVSVSIHSAVICARCWSRPITIVISERLLGSTLSADPIRARTTRGPTGRPGQRGCSCHLSSHARTSLTATGDTFVERQPDMTTNLRMSQPEAVKDDPPRAHKAQRPTSFSLKSAKAFAGARSADGTAARRCWTKEAEARSSRVVGRGRGEVPSGGYGRLLQRRARTREPPWEVVFTRGPLPTGFADGSPAFDDLTLVGWRRVAPIRLLSVSELTFGDLDELVLALHGQIVRTLHTGRTVVSTPARPCRAPASWSCRGSVTGQDSGSCAIAPATRSASEVIYIWRCHRRDRHAGTGSSSGGQEGSGSGSSAGSGSCGESGITAGCGSSSGGG